MIIAPINPAFCNARDARLERQDTEGRHRCASDFFGETISSWRQLTPEMMRLFSGAIIAGAVQPGWHYVAEFAESLSLVA